MRVTVLLLTRLELVLTYGVSSTNTVFGLPAYVPPSATCIFVRSFHVVRRAEKHVMLRSYCMRYMTDRMHERRRPYPKFLDPEPTLVTYDLCCQYFKNMHALQFTEHT
jgi:hypothetical protein